MTLDTYSECKFEAALKEKKLDWDEKVELVFDSTDSLIRFWEILNIGLGVWGHRWLIPNNYTKRNRIFVSIKTIYTE